MSEPKAYLATTATRLALNHLRSARLHRESYQGTWLPEPVLTGPGPEEHAEMADSLSMAFLVVLESLSPTERAVFLLHEVFGYEHKEIAEMTGTSAANSRQILARARRRVDEGKPRFEASRAQREEVARRFFAAADGGDLDGLLRALAPDVVYFGDGGGKARAVAAPLYGRDRVARFLAGLFRRIRNLEASYLPKLSPGQGRCRRRRPDHLAAPDRTAGWSPRSGSACGLACHHGRARVRPRAARAGTEASRERSSRRRHRR